MIEIIEISFFMEVNYPLEEEIVIITILIGNWVFDHVFSFYFKKSGDKSNVIVLSFFSNGFSFIYACYH